MVNNRSIIFADSYHGLFSVNLETKKQTRLFPRHDDNDFDLMNSTFKFLNSLQVHEDAIYITHSSAVYQREEFVNAFLEPDCSGWLPEIIFEDGFITVRLLSFTRRNWTHLILNFTSYLNT